jgi:hypothetical protein
MDKFLSENIISLGLSLSIATALFFSFRAGQAFGRIYNNESFHEIALGKLKQKTVNQLKMLFSTYRENHEDVNLPEEIHFNDIVERLVLINDGIQDQILGLHQIYLDLICKGTSSSYFVDILGTYGHLIS